MAIFRVEYVRDSKKKIEWFDSREEAEERLIDVAAEDAIRSIPHNGVARVQAFKDAVPKYMERLENINEAISEWIPPQKK